jgi:hypothetical protein
MIATYGYYEHREDDHTIMIRVVIAGSDGTATTGSGRASYSYTSTNSCCTGDYVKEEAPPPPKPYVPPRPTHARIPARLTPPKAPRVMHQHNPMREARKQQQPASHKQMRRIISQLRKQFK